MSLGGALESLDAHDVGEPFHPDLHAELAVGPHQEFRGLFQFRVPVPPSLELRGSEEGQVLAKPEFDRRLCTDREGQDG